MKNTTTENTTTNELVSKLRAYGIPSKDMTTIVSLSENGKVTFHKHGLTIVGLKNNDRLYLLVWDDGTMEVGGNGNACSFSLSDINL